MTSLKLIPSRILFLLLCVFLSACSAKDFKRNLEDTMGSLARTHVSTLGSPDKECALVKLDISKSYAVTFPRKILRLGEEYHNVRVVKQFVDEGTDFAVLECAREDGTLQNMLLRMDSASQVGLFILTSTSNKPFDTVITRNETLLTQETNTPKDLRVWFVERSGIHGPTIMSRSKIYGAAKNQTHTASSRSRTASSPAPVRVPLAPLITPDASMRLEDDNQANTAQRADEQPSSSATSTPIIVIDAPVSAPQPAEQPAPAPTSATSTPTIVIDAPVSTPQPAEQPAPAPTSPAAPTPVIIIP